MFPDSDWRLFFMGVTAAIGLASATFFVFEGTTGRALSLVLFLLMIGMQPLSSFREKTTLSTFALSTLLTAGALTVIHALFQYQGNLIFQERFMIIVSTIFGAFLALLWLLAIRVEQPGFGHFMTRILPGMLASALIMGVLISLQFRYYRAKNPNTACSDQIKNRNRTVEVAPEKLPFVVNCWKGSGQKSFSITVNGNSVFVAPKK